MLRRAGLAFDCEVVSIPVARHFASRKVKEWGFAGIRDDVALLVSELVTNVVRHTDSGGIIDLVEQERGMHVAVTDGSRDEPIVGRGDPVDPSGRGLKLVEHLASEWGVVVRREGKTVWFELVATRCAPPLPA